MMPCGTHVAYTWYWTVLTDLLDGVEELLGQFLFSSWLIEGGEV